jgi:outer membrane protein assembly factor BamB
MNVGARTVAGNGLTYLLTGHPAQLIALKQTASGMVSKNEISWLVEKAVPSRPSLLLLGDLLFAISDDGIFSCFDAGSGKKFFSERQNGAFSASPVAAGGLIYLPNQTGKTMVVKASKSFEPVATNALADGCMASPAVSGDAILLRTKTHLYCIGKK